jgi:hypothetical protein
VRKIDTTEIQTYGGPEIRALKTWGRAVVDGSSDRGSASAGTGLALGDETTEIARIVAESAPGVERIPAAERVYAYVKAAILDRVYPAGSYSPRVSWPTRWESPVRRSARRC